MPNDFWPPEGDEAHERHREAAERGGFAEGHHEYDEAPFGIMVQAHFPLDRWSAVYFSWLSLKGFLAGVHHVEATRLMATQTGDEVYITTIVSFSSGEALGAWLQYGYPVEEMLRAVGVGADDIRTTLVREIA